MTFLQERTISTTRVGPRSGMLSLQRPVTILACLSLSVSLLSAGFACSGQEFTSNQGVPGNGGASEGGGAGSPGANAGRASSGASSEGATSGVGGKKSAAGGSSDVSEDSAGAGGANGGTGGAPDTAGGANNDSAGAFSNSGGASGAGNTKGGANNGGSPNPSGGMGSSPRGGTGGANSGGALSTGGKAGSGGTANPSGGSPGTGGTEPLGGCDQQLLANANFDQGPTATWTETSTWPGIHIVTSRSDTKLKAEAVSPYSGDYLAWLGGIPDNEYDHHLLVLTQKVTIPAEAAMLTLSGRYWVKTLEDPSEAFDEAYLEFEGVDESVVWQASHFTNQDVTSGWTAFEESTTELSALSGQTLTFVAYSRTDLTGKTSIFLDSLRLVATCGH